MKRITSFVALAGLLGLLAACNQPAATPQSALPEFAVPESAEQAEAPQPARPVKLVQATAKTATLRVKFILDGKAPAPSKIDGSRDPFCGALDILTDDLIVSKEGGIKNIALMLDERGSKIDIPDELRKAPQAVHKLDNKNCMFEPQVLLVRTGQAIDVINSDQSSHNANFSFFKNDPINILIPPGASKKITPQEAEIAAIPVECNIHPWMKAHVIVTDHPFVGLSNEDGVLEISDLPPGEVTFRVWHRIGKIDAVSVGGKPEEWKRSRAEFTLKPGMNDLGEVKISLDKFGT